MRLYDLQKWTVTSLGGQVRLLRSNLMVLLNLAQVADSEFQLMAQVGYLAVLEIDTAHEIILKPRHALKPRADATLADFVDAERQRKLNHELKVQAFKIKLRPINVDKIGSIFFPLLLKNQSHTILTSATLQVARSENGRSTKSFRTLMEHLGLMDEWVKTCEFASPFDYAHRSLVWLESGFSQQYGQQQMDFARVSEVLAKIPGGILMLARSYKVVGEYAEWVKKALPGRKVFKACNDGTFEESLNSYKEAIAQGQPAVLIGSVSCGTGINLPGAEVQAVVIDRLWFNLSDKCNKLLQKYLNHENNYAYFKQCDLPAALVALKQGCGRLIRTEQDWGVVILMTPIRSSYVNVVKEMLQPMPSTSNQEEVLNFIERMKRVQEGNVVDSSQAAYASEKTPQVSQYSFDEEIPF